MSLEELKKMDVLCSMKETVNAINAALDSLNGDWAGTHDREILDVVLVKLREVDEIYERPLDSAETLKRLLDVAKKAGKADLREYAQKKVDLLEANRLHSDGYIWMFYGNYVKAVELLKEAARLAPDHPVAPKDLETAESRLLKAREELIKSDLQIEKKPDNSAVWLKKAAALAALGRTEEALPVFDKAIALDPTNPDALAKKGAALEGLGKFKDAVPLFNRALEIKPTSRTANKGLALAEYIEQGGT